MTYVFGDIIMGCGCQTITHKGGAKITYPCRSHAPACSCVESEGKECPCHMPCSVCGDTRCEGTHPLDYSSGLVDQYGRWV